MSQREYISGETLSLVIEEAPPPGASHREEQDVDGHPLVLGVVRAS